MVSGFLGHDGSASYRVTGDTESLKDALPGSTTALRTRRGTTDSAAVKPAAVVPDFRKKWSNISEYVKEIKQSFTRFYNKRHNHRGTFWAGRFKAALLKKEIH